MEKGGQKVTDTMWNRNYLKEPVDFKLLFLRLLRFWWIGPVCIVAGGVLFGGIYLLKTAVFSEPLYLAEAKFGVEYQAGRESQPVLYFNQTTWGEAVNTDVFLN